jgi:hypothetical protein
MYHNLFSFFTRYQQCRLSPVKRHSIYLPELPAWWWKHQNIPWQRSLPNWPLTTGLKNKSKATFEIEQCWIFAILWWPFWKWRPVEIFRCRESILRNIYQSPFSKWPPQYRTNSTLSDFSAISYVARLWCPDLIPYIEKFLLVSIFKMATTIPQKFNIVRFQR